MTAPAITTLLAEIEAGLKHLPPGPWESIVDDTGGEFSGWPSVMAPPEVDAAIVHRAGFKQEYWGDWSMRDANAIAQHIARTHPNNIRAILDHTREQAEEIERPTKVTDAMVRAGVAAATKAMWKAPDDAPAQETIIRAALEAALKREDKP